MLWTCNPTQNYYNILVRECSGRGRRLGHRGDSRDASSTATSVDKF